MVSEFVDRWVVDEVSLVDTCLRALSDIAGYVLDAFLMPSHSRSNDSRVLMMLSIRSVGIDQDRECTMGKLRWVGIRQQALAHSSNCTSCTCSWLL